MQQLRAALGFGSARMVHLLGDILAQAFAARGIQYVRGLNLNGAKCRIRPNEGVPLCDQIS
jgi:hypothetical protein